MEKQTIEISSGTLWKALFFVLLAVVVFVAHRVVLGLFLALVISSGVEVFVNMLEKRGMPRTLGIIVVFFGAALLMTAVIYFMIPLLTAEFVELFTATGEGSFRAWTESFLQTRIGESVQTAVQGIADDFLQGGLTPLGAFADIVGGAGLAVAVIVSAFYLSVRREGVDKFIIALFPEEIEEKALRIYANARRKIGLWFQGQVVLSCIVWILVSLALWIVGVPHAFLIGALAGVLEIVPFVGPILSGAVAVLIGFTVSPAIAIYALVVFLLIQQLESNFLVPLLMRRAVGLHPVVVIMSLLAGIELWGFLGALVAVPAAAVFQEIIDDKSFEKVVEMKTEA